MRIKSLFLIVFLLFLSNLLTAQKQKPLPNPKNIIVMIGDGMGFNHIQSFNLYEGKKAQVWEEFPVRLALSHYPALAGEFEKGNPESNYIATGYNPALAWKDTAYLKRDYTESAASGSALGTGFKTYNNAIGLSVAHDTLENLTERAKAIGKSAGVVTSVPFCHATPAAFTAHNETRKNYSEIAGYMLFESRCDVIMGCGDPSYDKNGNPVTGRWKYANNVVDSLVWTELISGSGKQTQFRVNGSIKKVKDVNGDRQPDAWTLVRTRDEFRKLQSGKTPRRVLGVPLAGSTLQQGRSMKNGETKDSEPFVTPFIKTVPTLEEMSLAAINLLDNNKNGFFLMIEGGAIDWTGHGNQKGRLIEEMQDFSRTAEAVIQWVEKYSSWEETMVVITADHETGLLWGIEPFQPLVDNGKGKLPDMTFYSDDHSNSLVGFFAKGAGSDLYLRYADEYDEVRGPFLQNSEVAQLIKLLWYK